jgi:hypothetical protein
MDPQPRILRLSLPYMRGRDVAAVQRVLGVEADGQFGPQTAGAVAEWKRARGDAGPDPELTPAQQRRLLRDLLLRAVRLEERWAAAGVGEEPMGSDFVPVLSRLAGRLGVAPELARMGFPWCAFAVFLAALAAGGKTAALGLRRRAFNALYAPSVLAAAEAELFGLRLVPPAEAWRGDLVLFDWDFYGGDPADHVGRLVAAPANGLVSSVDGNSGPAGVVALRERPLVSVRAFARDG